MIIVTYEYKSAYEAPVRHSCRCQNEQQAEKLCKMVEDRKERGYKLVDVTRECDEE